MITQDIPQKPEVGFDFKVGSFGTHEEAVRSAGTINGVQYMINTSTFNTDGYRQNSNAQKEQTTAKLKFNLNNDARVTILANYQNSQAKEPIGLKRVGSTVTNAAGTWNEYSFLTDREKAPTVAFVNDLKSHKENTQIGAKLDYDLNQNNNISLVGYAGRKLNMSTISLSGTSNANRKTTAKKNYYGYDALWNNTGKIFNRDYLLTSGLSYGYFSDDRDDINGTGTLYTGSVIRDDLATGNNFDQFIQGQIAVLNNVDVHAGVRHSNIKMKVASNVSAAQSGDVEYDKTTPVAGVLWKVNPALNLYANYGKGFETPTLIEIIYKQDPITGAATSNGPNLNIKPMTSDNYEIGAKTFLTPNTRANIAYFNTKTTNEIVIVASGSFPVYGNAAKTKRQGIEASIDSTITENLKLYGAYTYLDARFDGEYQPIGGTLVTSGNRIPGTYKQQVYGEVSWKYPALGFNTAFEGRHNSKVYVNDANSDAASSWTIFSARAGFTQNVSNWKVSEYVRVENIFDKEYVGSIRVNDNSSRFFEPAAGRNYMMGVSATYQF
jgi:iron complex outermembrane receptor protein